MPQSRQRYFRDAQDTRQHDFEQMTSNGRSMIRLSAIPRVSLARLPTPLYEAKQLRNALGGPSRCPKILVKRDDLTGVALGGNKVRKLEFLLADALHQHATIVITSGHCQSNSATITAAGARTVGLRSALILSGRPDELRQFQGNLLLNKIFGAQVYFVKSERDTTTTIRKAEAKVNEIVSHLLCVGERPYVIPTGGSNAIGALGYVEGTLEIVKQLARMEESPSHLFFASGSRGTHAGLLLASIICNTSYKPHGITISFGEPEKTTRTITIADEAARMLGVNVNVKESDVISDHRFIGSDYGASTDEALHAIKMMALSEGMVLDPVYSGKALAGMIHYIRSGCVDPNKSVVFLHTGGVPGLFAKAAYFKDA